MSILVQWGLGILAFLGLLFKSFQNGKKSVTIKNNEGVVKDVENLNEIKREVSNLNDADLDARVQQYTKRKNTSK